MYLLHDLLWTSYLCSISVESEIEPFVHFNQKVRLIMTLNPCLSGIHSDLRHCRSLVPETDGLSVLRRNYLPRRMADAQGVAMRGDEALSTLQKGRSHRFPCAAARKAQR